MLDRLKSDGILNPAGQPVSEKQLDKWRREKGWLPNIPDVDKDDQETVAAFMRQVARVCEITTGKGAPSTGAACLLFIDGFPVERSALVNEMTKSVDDGDWITDTDEDDSTAEVNSYFDDRAPSMAALRNLVRDNVSGSERLAYRDDYTGTGESESARDLEERFAFDTLGAYMAGETPTDVPNMFRALGVDVTDQEQTALTQLFGMVNSAGARDVVASHDLEELRKTARTFYTRLLGMSYPLTDPQALSASLSAGRYEGPRALAITAVEQAANASTIAGLLGLDVAEVAEQFYAVTGAVIQALATGDRVAIPSAVGPASITGTEEN